MFVEKIKETDFSDLFLEDARINEDYKMLMERWNSAISSSFKLARPSKNRRKGIDEHVKQLMNEERKLKNQVDSVEKKRKLVQLHDMISEAIADNVKDEMEKKMEKLRNSSCPQAEVFKVRRESKKTESMDFPLKDWEGNVSLERRYREGHI